MASATATNLSAPAQSAPEGANTSKSTQFPPINIGTRNSTLAQIQARAVAAALKSAHPERTYNICPVVVEGDRDKITPLQQLSQGENAKSLWTGELETMLEKGDLDIIVHCLKDMPTQLPDNLELALSSTVKTLATHSSSHLAYQKTRHSPHSHKALPLARHQFVALRS